MRGVLGIVGVILVSLALNLVAEPASEASLVFRVSPISVSQSVSNGVGYALGLSWLERGEGDGHQWSVLEADFSNGYAGGDGDLMLTSAWLFGGEPAGKVWAGLRAGVDLRLGTGGGTGVFTGVLRLTPGDGKAAYETSLGVSTTGDVIGQITVGLELF